VQLQDDQDLLREYVEEQSGAAFSMLVDRHVNKVYSVALRHTGNAHQAQDVTQAVFVLLSLKAQEIGPRVILSGWTFAASIANKRRIASLSCNRRSPAHGRKLRRCSTSPSPD